MRGPVFVGGAQRSGTHALGHLLGSHSRLFMIPRELVVHCTPGAIPGFLRGEVTAQALAEALRGKWWKRTVGWDPGITRGLFKLIDPEEHEAAVRAFEATAEADPPGAARALIEALAAPSFRRSGKAGWVEMSPTNIGAAGDLARLFPEARFVHIVRDGRDVACSIVPLPWGPRTLEHALAHWAKSLEAAAAGTRAAGRDRVLVLELERLVIGEPDRAYAELLEFAGLEDEPAMRRFLAEELTARRAHIGRWRIDVPVAEQDQLTELYRELRERLQAGGVTCVPTMRDDGPAYAPAPAEPPNPFDPWSDGRAADA
jgi:hypothetical protein